MSGLAVPTTGLSRACDCHALGIQSFYREKWTPGESELLELIK